jgi:hypothetical protein
VTCSALTPEDFGISFYPAVLVLVKNKIVYHGDIENVDDAIQRYLNEPIAR